MTKKLQGTAANSVSWCTNVGNKNEEILVLLLTTSESLDNLGNMTKGLMAPFDQSQQEPPRDIYTDIDCCNLRKSKFQLLFDKWPNLIVPLDTWHFIRRLSTACNNESHPLYGIFMNGISAAIYRWDPEDVSLLRDAKRAEIGWHA